MTHAEIIKNAHDKIARTDYDYLIKADDVGFSEIPCDMGNIVLSGMKAIYVITIVAYPEKDSVTVIISDWLDQDVMIF